MRKGMCHRMWDAVFFTWILGALNGVGLSGCTDAVAEDATSVVGLWSIVVNSESYQYLFKLHFLVDDSTFVSTCYDETFCREKAGTGIIQEKGIYSASADSIFITIKESDLPDRVGIRFSVTFSRTGPFITFTNALRLTFGYARQDQFTLEDDQRGPSRMVGWWAVYDPNEIEHAPLLVIRLDVNSLFYLWGGAGRQETGTYAVSGDSIMIEVGQSDLADRVGIRFTVTFSIEEPTITFTNAPMLTAGYTQEETITLERAVTGARRDTWGRIKSQWE